MNGKLLSYGMVAILMIASLAAVIDAPCYDGEGTLSESAESGNDASDYVFELSGNVLICKGFTEEAKSTATVIKIPDKYFYIYNEFPVTQISESAFADNKNITSITLGRNVVNIGQNAFRGESNVQSITFKGQPTLGLGNGSFNLDANSHAAANDNVNVESYNNWAQNRFTSAVTGGTDRFAFGNYNPTFIDVSTDLSYYNMLNFNAAWNCGGETAELILNDVKVEYIKVNSEKPLNIVLNGNNVVDTSDDEDIGIKLICNKKITISGESVAVNLSDKGDIGIYVESIKPMIGETPPADCLIKNAKIEIKSDYGDPSSLAQIAPKGIWCWGSLEIANSAINMENIWTGIDNRDQNPMEPVIKPLQIANSFIGLNNPITTEKPYVFILCHTGIHSDIEPECDDGNMSFYKQEGGFFVETEEWSDAVVSVETTGSVSIGGGSDPEPGYGGNSSIPAMLVIVLVCGVLMVAWAYTSNRR